MARRLDHDIPGTDWRLPYEEGQGSPPDWSAHFGTDAALVVEIGFGRGEFLMELAGQSPETPHLGIEYSAKRALKLARRLARSELQNVRLIQARAEEVVANALASESVASFWINFPDPWPKKRHFKRRLIQPAFVALLARRLAPGGSLEIATDHAAYAEWIDEILRDAEGLVNLHAPRPSRPDPPPGRKATAYELKWRALGRSFHFFSYQRVAQ